MFDMLTLDELYALHSTLADESRRVHVLTMASPVFSDAWNVSAAKHSEIAETMHAIHVELTRREQERADA